MCRLDAVALAMAKPCHVLFKHVDGQYWDILANRPSLLHKP